ncbi:DF family (seleno)protein [Streptomyces sp. NPDC001966]
MKIELLIVPGCPNSEPAADQIRQMIGELGLHDAAFQTRTITDHAAAEAAGFTGSPTILIDGQDPFAELGREAGVTCRLYQTPHGPAGIPTADQLRQALSNAL